MLPPVPDGAGSLGGAWVAGSGSWPRAGSASGVAWPSACASPPCLVAVPTAVARVTTTSRALTPITARWAVAVPGKSGCRIPAAPSSTAQPASTAPAT